MAGLYGYFALSPQPASEVRDRLRWMRSFMTSRPSHRFVEHAVDGAGIGNTGTGIFDGSLALHQRPNGRTLVADGEIYHGETWAGVHERWARNGAPAIADVDGVYNAVEIDASAGLPRLSIFNDRYGSRRLYVARADAAFVFASEMAPLVAWLGDAAAIDEDFVRESLCLGSPYGDRTWIRGITLVPPAIAMSVSREGVKAVRYWNWSSLPPQGTHTGADRFDVLDGLWQRAMHARVEAGRGAGRTGQQLSGGLDSRLILGEAVLQRPDWVTTTYGEPRSDDVRFAQRAARAAGVPWLFLELPGDDWLARRLALSVEHDGIVDIANAHHAGFLDTIAGAMAVEVSGYLGDAVMAGTGTDLTPESALSHLGYYASPVSLDLAEAHDRISTAAASAESAWIWMLENKWRRATNAWPHLAVDHLEVRKPFMDYALVAHCHGLPLADRVSRAAQTAMLLRRYPALASVPWQKTGVRPSAGPLARAAIKGVRLAYRRLQPLARRAGLPVRSWLRNACDINAWCGDPAIERALHDCLTDRGALIASVVGPRAIEQTLAMAFATPRQVAIEVPINLYRAEHMLRRWHDMRRRAPASWESVASGR